jgi:hypothetical protein
VPDLRLDIFLLPPTQFKDQSLSEKLAIVQALKKFPTFYVIQSLLLIYEPATGVYSSTVV